jgi:hypothetical protein
VVRIVGLVGHTRLILNLPLTLEPQGEKAADKVKASKRHVRHRHVRCRFEAHFAIPCQAIAGAMEKSRADLIIATHGHLSAANLLPGSAAEAKRPSIVW